MKTNMIGIDSYYTPVPTADKLAAFVTEKNINTAVDFCVGDGALLKAVEKKMQGVKFFGTDISRDVIEKNSVENPTWTLGVCDFRDDESIQKLPFLKDASFDLIMFNPPFSCKGGLIEHVSIDERNFKVSTAMMFIMKAIKYLSSTGSMYAILPISCVYSQKDKIAWQYLQNTYNACVLEEPKRVCFGNNCSPNIVLVYLGNHKKATYSTVFSSDFSMFSVNSIVRGCTRMQKPAYSSSKKAVRLIHTTNIQEGRLVHLKRIMPGFQQIIGGFGVVIPRVCNPSPKKVALLDGRYDYILSDCVIAIRTSTKESAVQIKSHIINNWPSFKGIYKGTGAQYTTLERVKTLFGIK